MRESREVFEFSKHTIIVEAHDTDIHCAVALPFGHNLGVNFATGAVQSIKLWRSELCIYAILTAHTSPIYSITAFLTADQQI